jgi:REP element-mobilizing transposase RayT
MRFHSHVGSLDDLHFPALFARIDTRRGYPALAQVDIARAVVMELLRTTARFEVEVVAYCVMPDHVALLLAGRVPTADPRAALRRWKQVSGSAHRERTGRTLWQPRCAEWPIEDVPKLWEVAAYLVLEPVRRRMARRVEEYRWLSAPPAVLTHLASRGRVPQAPEWWPEAGSVSAARRSGRSSPRSATTRPAPSAHRRSTAPPAD